MQQKLLSHQATILPVSSVEDSIIYYTSKLDFSCVFKWDEPASYAVLKRDEITINLTLSKNPLDLDNASVYIFCYNIRLVYQEYVNNEVIFEEKLSSTDYGMNEFVISDPDNNKLVFGQSINTNN
ncbi:VOC family protein [Psychroserpens luteolus]|uniref:VOC family protein n=1 Tax=Psychroserpens luteolus TaxID=2855840 RepID=UPI001E63C214|nr:VOC family protein [Psychroserpens luteolus]MCD2260192.1 hypothetical protein [Psychroserpens luteolus]